MNKITTTILCLALSLAMQGQTVRTMHYFPDGRDIVCLNGENRYTRALYGTNTRFRLETSDRPVFAAYDRAESSNLGFFAIYDGKELNLDSTEWCESRYGRGRRSYVLKDSSWGNGRLEIVALASFFSESALFQFKTEGFDKPLTLKVRRGPMTDTKMTRDGELGIDPREKFELSPDCKDPEIIEWNGKGETYCLLKDKKELSVLDAAQGAPLFAKETEAFDELTSRVEFNTPDPFINTIGGNLVASADGMWDGTTWLHGCVGWRTPLAGWRGGYVGDAVGWSERSRLHFIAYANSMVTDVPPVIPFTQDPNTNLASGLHQWGTQMYSNGYISKLPNRTDQISHYDMNLNYMDELLRHFSYDADTAFMKQMWPYIKLHLEWEKRNWDPDNDHLYDAYISSENYNRVGTSVKFSHTAEPENYEIAYKDGYTGEEKTTTYKYPDASKILYSGHKLNDQLTKIITQKFIANMPYLPLENWSEHRRLGLPFWEIPSGTNLVSYMPEWTQTSYQGAQKWGYFPQRMVYPNSLKNADPKEFEHALQLLNAEEDIAMAPIWWAIGGH